MMQNLEKINIDLNFYQVSALDRVINNINQISSDFQYQLRWNKSLPQEMIRAESFKLVLQTSIDYKLLVNFQIVFPLIVNFEKTQYIKKDEIK
jgi:ribosomal protein S10